jgi:hypothetical protein
LRSLTVANSGKQRGRPFAKGESGNPAGKPRGARHKATLAAEVLFDGEAEGLTRKAIELALGGDAMALRLCLERILPVRRERPVHFDLPPLQSAADAGAGLAAITAAVAAGELTPGEARELAQLVDAFVKALERTDFEQRLRVLENKTRDDAAEVVRLNGELRAAQDKLRKAGEVSNGKVS